MQRYLWTFLLVALFAGCAAPQPKEPAAGLSPEAQAVVDQWRENFQASHSADSAPATFAEELSQRVAAEQAGRNALSIISEANLSAGDRTAAYREVWSVLAAYDAENTNFIKANLPDDGWFRISRDGERVARDAWLIVQHSPDTDFQNLVLSRMAPLVENGDAASADYALLFDRVAMYEGRPQRFGSQAYCTNGVMTLWELEDPENIDALRAQMGLGPLENYRNMLGVGSPC